jgi:hypothetical protein
MPRRRTIGGSLPAPLSGSERRAARVDAFVKDQLATEREADELKRQKLKALRIGHNAPALELGT